MPSKYDTREGPARFEIRDLRGMAPDEMRVARVELYARAQELHEDSSGQVRDKSDSESREFKHCMVLIDAIDAHLAMDQQVRAAVRRNPRAVVRAGAETRDTYAPRGRLRNARWRDADGRGPEFVSRAGWVVDDMAEVFRLGDDDARDRALGALEERGAELGLAPAQLDRADQLMRSVLSAERPNTDGGYIARRTLITESPAYRSAFQQLLTDPHPLLTNEEIESVRALRALESRAMSEGTPSAGGVGVPVFIDPTIVYSAGAGSVPLLDVCRTETITTSAWKGVSSAGMTWSWDPEGSAVSDDSPTLAQPVVPVYMGRGFLPYSIEVGQDYPGFAEQMAGMLAQGAMDMLATSTAVGTGSAQPTGITVKLEATAGSKVKVATAGALVAADIFKCWNALGERFRSHPSTAWFMNVGVESTIRSFSSPTSTSAFFTIDLTQEGLSFLNGKRVVRSDYAPGVVGVTTTQSYATVGAFENYLVAMRAGMQIEPVSVLFDQATGRPSGSRGLFAWLRSGHDCINPPAFRILDQT